MTSTASCCCVFLSFRPPPKTPQRKTPREEEMEISYQRILLLLLFSHHGLPPPGTLGLSSKSSINARTRHPFTDLTNRVNSGERLYILRQPGIRPSTSHSLNRGECIVHQGHIGLQTTPTSSRCLTAVSSISRIISGYWVAPDVEDGWGYIEAVVDQVISF